MRIILNRLAVAGMAGLFLTVLVAAHADEDEDEDHDRARDLYEHGEIKGLPDILRLVRARAPGDVVAVDLIRGSSRWIYRLQVVASDGRRRTVDIDAGAGVVIRGDGAD